MISKEIWSRFSEHSQLGNNRSVVMSREGALSYANVRDLADRFALKFASDGISEGDLVVFMLPNMLSFLPALLALCKLSATIALVSPKYGVGELKPIIDGIQPRGFITNGETAMTLREILPTGTKFKEMSDSDHDFQLVIPPKEQHVESKIPDSTVFLKFTSGSTGVPKGIPLSLQNVVAEAENVISTLRITPDDAILAPVPLVHSYGFDLGVLPTIFAGSTLYLHDSFVPRVVLSDLREKRASIFLGVPSMYRFLTEIHSKTFTDLSHVRYLLSCTAPLPANLINAFHERYHAPICQHYGSSETGAISTHVPSEVLSRSSSVGLPMNNVSISIIDEDGNALGSGFEGEVVIRSEAVSSGYVLGAPLGRSPFREGTYWTGDLGVLDEKGFLTVKGRLDDVINVGGLKVYPHEVRQVLESYPAIREAVVIGVKDRMGEQVVFAAVTLNDPATEQQMLEHCRARLSDYKIPRRIETRDELPRGPSGKVRLRPEDVTL